MTADHFHKKPLLRNLKVLTSCRNREKIEQNDKSSKTYRVSNRSIYIYVYCSESYLLQKWRRSNAGWFLHSSSFTPFHVTRRLLMADLPSSLHARRNGRDPRTIHRGRRSTGTLFTMEDRHPPEPLARVVSSSWSRTLRPKNSPVSVVFVDLHEMNEARLFRCWCSDPQRGWTKRWWLIRV